MLFLLFNLNSVKIFNSKFLTQNFNAINQHFLFQSLFKCKIYNFL